jgi:5-carboxymethyl-2-hydroxymuconic-semialdehyde dehydrogenase
MNPADSFLKKLETRHFVDGQRIAAYSSDTYQSINPSDGSVLATFSLANEEDVDRAVCAARKAFDKGPWPRLSDAKRVALLHRFADGIAAHAEQLGTIEAADVGKLLSECINHDVARASANIRFFADAITHGHSEAFFKQSKFLDDELETLSVTRRMPIGVAGLIVPWNSPLMLATWKLGPCLASGNTCVLKPSPWALLSILQLGEIANEAGIPPGVLNIVPGDVLAGEALVSHRGVNRISFTGSVTAGKAVQIANAQCRLAPVSLELGGKSPSIVFADADLEAAVAGVARGIFRSQGQSCVAGSRLLVEESIKSEFVEKLESHIDRYVIGSALDSASTLGPLVSEEHLLHVESMIAKAVEEGARLYCGGDRPEKPAKGFYIKPCIFDEVSPEMEIWRSEVFGPVLSVIGFKDEAEALNLANDSEFGLSSSVWTSSHDKAMRVSFAIESGMTWVNSHFLRDLRSPFGGIKDSGVGSEGGNYSLDFYTRPKMVCLPWKPAS